MCKIHEINFRKSILPQRPPRQIQRRTLEYLKGQICTVIIYGNGMRKARGKGEGKLCEFYKEIIY